MARILVVDDMAVDRCLIQGILQKEALWQIETANGGAEALARLEEAGGGPIDLVVTDLNMPEPNGLELVTQMRFQHPTVPVILITAHGSEELAIAALESGAASYVPKTRLADKLRVTVEQVLATRAAERSYEQLSDGLRETTFRFEIANEFHTIRRLVELVQQFVGAMNLCDAADEIRFVMGLEEALMLAAFHGNLELTPSQIAQLDLRGGGEIEPLASRIRQSPYRDRRLHVDVELTSAVGRLSIRHSGPEWDVGALRAARDPAAVCGLDQRSLLLMMSLLEDIDFDDDGQSITIIQSNPTQRTGSGALLGTTP